MTDRTYLHTPSPAEIQFRIAFEKNPYDLERVSDQLHRVLNADHIVSVISIYADARLYMGTFTEVYDAVQAVRAYNAECGCIPGIIEYTLLHHYHTSFLKKKFRKPEEPMDKHDEWTEPDYNNLLHAGIPVEVLYWRKRIYDSIPERPLSADANTRFREFLQSAKHAVESVTDCGRIFDFNSWLKQNGYFRQDASNGWIETKKEENIGMRPVNVATSKKALKSDAVYDQFCGLYDSRMAEVKKYINSSPNMSLLRNRIHPPQIDQSDIKKDARLYGAALNRLNQPAQSNQKAEPAKSESPPKQTESRRIKTRMKGI